MTDLTDLLDRASDLGETPVPIADDLARARAALRSRRRKQGLVTVGSLCVVGVLAARRRTRPGRRISRRLSDGDDREAGQ